MIFPNSKAKKEKRKNSVGIHIWPPLPLLPLPQSIMIDAIIITSLLTSSVLLGILYSNGVLNLNLNNNPKEQEPSSSNWDSINAITLATRDMSEACSFYTDLGLEISYGGPESNFTTVNTGDGHTFSINLFTAAIAKNITTQCK